MMSIRILFTGLSGMLGHHFIHQFRGPHNTVPRPFFLHWAWELSCSAFFCLLRVAAECRPLALSSGMRVGNHSTCGLKLPDARKVAAAYMLPMARSELSDSRRVNAGVFLQNAKMVFIQTAERSAVFLDRTEILKNMIISHA